MGRGDISISGPACVSCHLSAYLLIHSCIHDISSATLFCARPYIGTKWPLPLRNPGV